MKTNANDREPGGLCRNILLCAALSLATTTAAWASKADTIARAKAAVRAVLKDPDSAKFSDFAGRDDMVCGFVNAKNSYGGMAGKQQFLYSAKSSGKPEDLKFSFPAGGNPSPTQTEAIDDVLVKGLCEMLRLPAKKGSS